MDLGYIIAIRRPHPRRRAIPLYRRILAVRNNAFDIPDEGFINLFRLPKVVLREIMALLHNELERPTQRHRAVPVGIQVLVSIRLLASGSFQNIVGESLFHQIRQPTVSKVFTSFLNALVLHAREFITFPTTLEHIANIKLGFQERLQFPGCLGCIDCTHIYIAKPNEEHWNGYLNRKGRFSVNIQMVCNSNFKITNVVAQYPGSVHDSYIYNNCALRQFLHSDECPPNSWLLGDSGYPLEHCLLTPIRAPNNEMEERYNVAHRHARNIIERVFGILKLVWRILHDSGGNLLYKPEKALKIVLSCCILHNIRRNHNFPVEFEDMDMQEELLNDYFHNPNQNDINQMRGEGIRQRLINNWFNF